MIERRWRDACNFARWFCSEMARLPSVLEAFRRSSLLHARHSASDTDQHAQYGHRIPQPGILVMMLSYSHLLLTIYLRLSDSRVERLR